MRLVQDQPLPTFPPDALPPVPGGGNPPWVTPELLERTRKCFSRIYGENLTSERALTILLNLGIYTQFVRRLG